MLENVMLTIFLLSIVVAYYAPVYGLLATSDIYTSETKRRSVTKRVYTLLGIAAVGMVSSYFAYYLL